MKFFSLLIFLLKEVICRDEIFLSIPSLRFESPCVAYDGSSGICRPLVYCSSFFAELEKISQTPCEISEGKNGVCCPQNKPQTRDLTSYNSEKVSKKEKKLHASSIQFHEACEKGLKNMKQMESFVRKLASRKIVAPYDTPVYWHSRLFETTNEIFKKGQDATTVLEASKEMMKTFSMNKEQAKNELPNFSVLGTSISGTCPSSSRCSDPNFGYRTMDGSCNNIQHPDRGKTGVAFTRMLPTEYGDGISTFRLSASNKPLPSARLVSTALTPGSSAFHSRFTILIWQWAQFVDHDLTHTPISKGANMADISCCANGVERQGTDLHPECLTIEIPQNDKFFSRFNQRCMEFVRSMPAIRPECKLGPREQMNQITGYLDGSNVYGSTFAESATLRTFNSGLLKVTMHLGRELLPGRDNHGNCVIGDASLQCFIAGDTRVNEQPDLAVMHMVWMRQHNNVARGLAKLNPGWSDEILYQEARRIIGAQMQHITYNEFLPIVLGRSYVENFGLLPLKEGYFNGYNTAVDATISNEFATAAFRYGHTLVTDHIFGFSNSGNLNENMEMSKFQFQPFNLYVPGVIDAMIRGLTQQQSLRFDRFVSEQLTNKLFAQKKEFGMDLVALNIQRGRDHGLAPYTKWRRVCELPEVNQWEDLFRLMDPEAIPQLRSIYESVHDIDLFIGGISERLVEGSLLGKTFLCIIGRQFHALRFGDRFYYENGNLAVPHFSFTQTQLQEIRKTSIARILCDNSDGVESMQPLAFLIAGNGNDKISCGDTSIPKISLEPWKNSRVWNI